ncbi:MAG: caspase family protein [Hyphomicrobiales bacterium]|nr:caspase family protein [Hyphomicrobiales bacterium]
MRWWVWLAFIVMTQSAYAQGAQKRVALVIGNSDYQKPGVNDLPNARRDAEAIGRLLIGIGFSVTAKYDLGYDGMRLALRDFGTTAEGADAALIHFAGHGIELSLGGGNFLVPVDAELKSPSAARQEMFSLSALEEAVASARGLKLIILDACRDNPFPQTVTRGAADRGLARPEPRERILVAFSARHGTKAQDGVAGGLSPFATALIEHLPTPGEEIRFIMGRVEDAVIKATSGVQQPFTYGSLGGEKVYLTPPQEQTNPKPGQSEAVTPPVIKPDPVVGEAERAWQLVDPTSKDQLRAIERRFPNTFYADLASARIVEIERNEVERFQQEEEGSARDKAEKTLQEANRRAEAERAAAAEQQARLDALRKPPPKSYSYVWDTRPPDDFLALRTEPSSRTGSRIAKMPNGTLLEVIEKRPDGWWYVRTIEGLEGWTKYANENGSRVWIYCCRSR